MSRTCVLAKEFTHVYKQLNIRRKASTVAVELLKSLANARVFSQLYLSREKERVRNKERK